MKESLIENYQKRIEDFRKKEKKARALVNRVALIRLGFFLLGGLSAYYFFSDLYWGLIILLTAIFLVVFLYLVRLHASYKDQLSYLSRLIKINQNEEKALGGDISEFKTGSNHQVAEHPYSFDLDIFGEKSIFQFIERTVTRLGEARLALSLVHSNAQSDKIKPRQEAIQELAQLIDWRQSFASWGQKWEEAADEGEKLIKWIQKPTHIYQKPIYRVLLWGFPIFTNLLLILAIFSLIPYQFVVLLALLQLIFVAAHFSIFVKHSQEISKKSKFLKKYALLNAQIEQEEFRSPLLSELQDKLTASNISSKEMKRLALIIDYMEQGMSLVGVIFNGLFMWSLQYLYQLEKWQVQNVDRLEDWLKVNANFDELNGLANMSYNHPKFIFPELNPDHFELKALSLGHPLIDESLRVDNDVLLKQTGQLIIITGANMAGKSTFLRTIGVNLILAMLGAPVCAAEMRFRPIQIYTSMRTNDSLQSSESFFYAELKKLRVIIEKLSEGEPIFIILDEILKGTNSADQSAGARALIEQLIRLKGVGLIATHDLSLGNLADTYPGQIFNHCFEIEIKGDQLSFDYKLREGINQNLNATFLMKKMGITL